MGQTLIINCGEFEFNRFDRATETLQEEYGFKGFGWDIVVASGDFEVLYDFLIDDGIFAELENNEEDEI